MQQALQSYGQPNWSLQLLSIGAVDPTQALAIELVCNRKFGTFCLDGSGLSQGAVKGIIAGGCIFLVLISALLCVFLDICHRSGRVRLPEHANSSSALSFFFPTKKLPKALKVLTLFSSILHGLPGLRQREFDTCGSLCLGILHGPYHSISHLSNSLPPDLTHQLLLFGLHSVRSRRGSRTA